MKTQLPIRQQLKVVFLIILFSMSYLMLYAQQGNIWYFGNHAGVDFNSGSPMALTNGALNTSEGCSTMSDPAGNLLFYTDGVTVYDRFHNIMLNGTGLLGNATTSQSALIVSKPGSTNLYYVFTVPPQGFGDFCYSIVDMNLAGGNGDVINKNTVVMSGPVCEKLAATSHENGVDVWIAIHVSYSDEFQVYLLTSSGLGTAVVSNVGSIPATGLGNIGYMKFSPYGNKIASALWDSHELDILDFDNSTGFFSTPLVFNIPITNFNVYGVEFSSSASTLYLSNGDNSIGQIYQLNLNAGSPAAIIASATIVHTFTTYTSFGALQIGPDHKIYFSRHSSPWLGVINNPDSIGTACNVDDFSIYLSPGYCNYGLPNYISDIYSSFTFKNLCFGDSTAFKLTNIGNLFGAQWSFGDTASGVNNSSTFFNPSHVFTSPGTYTVSVIKYYATQTNTIIKPITIHALPTINLGTDTSFCSGGSYLINTAGVHHSYLWQDSSINSTYTATVAGTYFVTVEDSGCYAADSITLSVYPCIAPVVNLYSSDTVFCSDKCIDFFDVSINNPTSWQWLFPGSATTSSTLQNPTNICYNNSGSFDVTLIACNAGGCDTLVMNNLITEYATPSISITLNAGTLYATPAYSYQWWNVSTGIIPGATTNYFVPSGVGDYYVVVTDSLGCSATSNIISVNVVAPSVNLMSTDTSFCEKQCIDFYDLSTNSPTSWQWFFPGADSTTSTLQNPTNICYNQYGSFDVTLIACNSAGCDTLILPGFINEYHLPAPYITLSNDTLFAFYGASYQWYTIDSGIIPGATNSYYIPTTGGNYFVIITDSIGCEGTSNIITITGISSPAFGESHDVKIIPNPNNGSFTIIINSALSKDFSLRIIDPIGRMITTLPVRKPSNRNGLNVTPGEIAKGIYTVEILNDGKVYRGRLVVE